MSERQLIFRDEQAHKRSFTYGDRDDIKFLTSYNNFVKKHVSEENSTFRVERVLTDEVLIVETAYGILGRSRNGEDSQNSYVRYDRRTDGSTIIHSFASSGYDATEKFGPWTSDRESLIPDESFENLELAWARELLREAQRRREIAALPKLDMKLLKQFCKIWADTGYNEYVSDSEVYYVLFGSSALEEVDASREELLKIVEALGLQVTEAPAGSSSGEVWVCSDPRVDREVEKWS